MEAKSMMMLAFLGVAACSAQREPLPRTAAAVAPGPQPTAAAVSPPVEPEVPPAAALREADRLYQSQLGASRGRFELDRQVAELRQAKLLYEQFLERAGNRPELEPAIRKSRERIVDVQQTIDFLLDANQPAPALSPAPAP